MSSKGSLAILLRSLYLSTMVREYDRLGHTAEQENWSYAQYLQSLCELELAERHKKRIERNLKKSNLPEGKTLATLNQSWLPVKIKRQLPQLLQGDFVERTENILAFGLPGRGKSHLLCAIGRELIIQKGYAVLFKPTFKLVEELLQAKRDLALEALLKRLDRFDVIILDDIGYVQQNREEMEVLFTFLAERYERRSLMITSNLVFSNWDKIFKDPMTTAAAIDRIVHHAIILELEGNSIREMQARSRQKNPSPVNKPGKKEVHR